MKQSILFAAIAASFNAYANPVDLTDQYEYARQVEPMPTGWHTKANNAKRGIRQEGCESEDYAVICHYQSSTPYYVYTQKGHATDIQLGPGEYLNEGITIGDTARWQVNVAITGEGAAQRQHLFVIPKRDRIYTNLLIPTNQRIYEIILSSAKTFRDRKIEWTYPAPLAKTGKRAKQPQKLDTQFTITPKESRYWEPLYVYSTDSKTYIVFPLDVKHRDLPVFYIAAEDELQLVNYRVETNEQGFPMFAIDRLVDHGVLKINREDEDAVHIYRKITDNKPKQQRISSGFGGRGEISIRDTVGNR